MAESVGFDYKSVTVVLVSPLFSAVMKSGNVTASNSRSGRDFSHFDTAAQRRGK